MLILDEKLVQFPILKLLYLLEKSNVFLKYFLRKIQKVLFPEKCQFSDNNLVTSAIFEILYRGGGGGVPFPSMPLLVLNRVKT